MHLDPCPQLPDPGSDLQELQTDRVELGPGPRRPLKMPSPQGMQKHIGHGMKEEPELIGLEPVAGGPVGEKMGLMVLDHQFHSSQVAVNHLVNDAARTALQVRHHEPEVRTQGVVLSLDDDPAVFLPASRPVGKFTEEPDRLPLPSVTPLGFFDRRSCLPAQHDIRRQSQGIPKVLRLAKLDDLGRGVVRIGPQQDPHLGPGLPDFPDHPLENRHELLTGRPFPRPQNRRHQLPAFSFVDVNRQITVLVVEGVEESELLVPVGRIFRVVDIQKDRHRRRSVRLDKRIGQNLPDAIKIRPRDGVLQPRERRLAGQRLVVGKSLAGHLQRRVPAQRIRVIRVLVAASDLEDPLLEHVQKRMPGVAGMAAIMKDFSDAGEKPHPAFDLPEEKHSGVGGDFAAVKVDFEFFSLEGFKKKPFGGMMNFVQSCFLLSEPKRIVYQYVRGETAFFMNISG